MITVSSFIIGNLAGNLFDQGFADLLGLQTLRHGTHFLSYLRIRIYGADPKQGGKKSGSNRGNTSDDTRNHFYMFKDPHEVNRHEAKFLKIDHLSFLSRITLLETGIRLKCRLHLGLSAYNFVDQISIDSYSPKIKNFLSLLSRINSLFSFLFSPSLLFRFSEIDSIKLKNDPFYNGLAYRTRQLVEPWRIGLLGSVILGINKNWFSRAKIYPFKLATGIVQIISAVAVIKLGAFFFSSRSFFIISFTLGTLLA